MAIEFVLNGQPVSVDLPGDTPLLWVLREGVGLTGTKFGCGVASCGACTVHLAGEPVRSCQTPLDTVAGRSVTTIEGVSGQVAQAVQAAWRELDVVQCGYCQSGQIMTAVGLLSTTPRPTDAEIDDRMAGNLCRCATYPRIRAAIHRAADMMEG